MLRNTVIKLIEELVEASQAYYQDGVQSPLSDEDFDNKQEYLRMVSTSPDVADLFEVGSDGWALLENTVALGSTVVADNTVQHNPPMLSLGKAKKFAELRRAIQKISAGGGKGFKLQAKLDGLAISATYNNGELTQIATRGNGIIGENVSYLINSKEFLITGLPHKIQHEGNLEVRGELFFTTEQFEEANTERFRVTGTNFKNPRNAASGLHKKAELGIGFTVNLTFGTYGAYTNGILTPISDIPKGFKTVDEITRNIVAGTGTKISNLQTLDEVFENINKFGENRMTANIPTDGVVVKAMNESEIYVSMGSTSHHPNSQVAWKYPSEKAETVVRDIIVTVGRTGKITPVATIDTVVLDGSSVSNASLHNFNKLYDMDVMVGSTVLVEKSNDIIPQVVTVVASPEGGVLPAVPTVCPECGDPLISVGDEKPAKTMLCVNDNCPSRVLHGLVYAVSKNVLDIDRLSKSTLTALYESGRINDISDLYTLTVEELARSTNGYTPAGKARVLGTRTATHIVEQLQKSRELPLHRLLPALSIKGLGKTNSKTVAKAFRSIDALLLASVSDIAALDGLATLSAERIVLGLAENTELINRLRSIGFSFVEPEELTSSKLSGLSFSISGAVPSVFSNRNEFVEYVENSGGKFNASPNKNTTIMVGNPDDSSSKIRKAKQLGVRVITPEEFISEYYAV